MDKKYDFSGWATRNNLKCSDGRTIIKDSFKHNDGQIVPLVWNHQHNDPLNVLGHALLENRDDGVYTYGLFNDTEAGKNAKLLVEHGDVSALSIYASQLKQQGSNVLHGEIREVSLVLAGANPGAFIDSIIVHDEESDDEAIIYTGEGITLYHAKDESKPETSPVKAPINEKLKEDPKASSDDTETVEDVFNTLSDKQRTVVYAMIGQALEDAGNSDGPETPDSSGEGDNSKNKNDNSQGGNKMKHNLFENEGPENNNVLSHADMESIIADAKRYGSLKESALAHGITDIDYLFPDAQSVATPPSFIQRDQTWVQKVMVGVHHTPFSRIKSIFADITADDARAKGYIAGKQKLEEVFSLLKRTTTPTTIYKKQKLDRDDVVDITDFDVVSWLKSEMRMMLDEEVARAVLVGDGRLSSSDEKINDQNIRPIWTDADLYTIKAVSTVASSLTVDQKSKDFIRTAIKARKNYKGSGQPTMFTSEDVLTDCLLLEDSTGRIIYESVEKLATALRVKEIVAIPVMTNLTRVVDTVTHNLMAIIVNLDDYNIGADKGGAVNMFDDFDIDYNAQKYLIETRCSGALIKPYSAITVEQVITA